MHSWVSIIFFNEHKKKIHKYWFSVDDGCEKESILIDLDTVKDAKTVFIGFKTEYDSDFSIDQSDSEDDKDDIKFIKLVKK